MPRIRERGQRHNTPHESIFLHVEGTNTRALQSVQTFKRGRLRGSESAIRKDDHSKKRMVVPQPT
jgi:hypothetical protein